MLKRCDYCGNHYEPKNKGKNASKSRFCNDKCKMRYHRKMRSVTHLNEDNEKLAEQYY